MGKKLPLLALIGLLSFGGASLAHAAEEPPTDAGMASEPDDPNAAPYPPDGVTDPNVEYPTDGPEGTDEGEAGAEAPAPSTADPAAPPAAGGVPPANGKKAPN